jgi:hypothetical protein
MKIIGWLFLIVLVAWLGACSNAKQQNAYQSIRTKATITKNGGASDTLAYVWRILDNGDTVGKGFHMHETLSYPQFKNDKLLNDTIENQIGNLGGWLDEPAAAKSGGATSRGVDDDNATSDIPDASQDMAVKIVAQYHGIIVINFSQDQSGGAHPNHMDTYLNWDIKKHEAISLADIFIENYEEKLDIVGQKTFRKDYGLKRKGDWGGYFENADFFLPDNFFIQPNGLNFVYGSYTIAPYMAGYPELLIPYSSIKKILRPNTVISQFIK